MKYNPNLHHRRSIRLKGYDYSQAGLYFITICCKDRIHRFGKIENNEMILNEYGRVAYNEWAGLSERFANYELDVFQIMPNHMHGIIVITNPIVIVGAGLAPAPSSTNNNDVINKNENAPNHLNNTPQLGTGAGASPAPKMTTTTTVGDMVGAYKSLVANHCLDIFKTKNGADIYMGKLWHRNYYEHIIRDEQSYQTISNYIINNPLKWGKDKFYTT